MTGEKMPTKSDILKIIDKYPIKNEIAFYGGTFTGLSIKKQIEILESVKFLNLPIRISTRPDEITEENLHILKKYNVKTIEIGIQSMFDDILSASNRGHTKKDNINAILLLQKFNFEISAHLMVGLPKDTKEKSLKTLNELINLNVNIFRIHPTLVFKNTKLEKLYLNNQYKPLTLEEAVDITSEMLLLIYANNAKAIRLGYFVPKQSLKNIVAGPHHPSFGDMVKTNVAKKIITRLNIKKVYYPKKYESWFYAYGNNKLNIEKIISDKFLFDNFDLSSASRMALRKEFLNG